MSKFAAFEDIHEGLAMVQQSSNFICTLNQSECDGRGDIEIQRILVANAC